MTVLLGPLACHECHRLVWWDRVGTLLRVMESPRHDRGPRLHRCPPTCGAVMNQAEDFCGRKRDHAGSHRSRWAMDNQARSRRKWLTAA